MIKAIPTTYKGITFRSRLEASWAEYFDYINLAWSYEPEGYLLPDGQKYLPDFFLSKQCLFVECKSPIGSGLDKAAKLAWGMQKSILIAFPDGRFFFCPPDEEYVSALGNNDADRIDDFMKNCSSLAIPASNCTDPTPYFWNGGEESDVYVGYPPDYMDSIKDRDRVDGGDARTWYYAGYSTWEQRGFSPTRWKPQK